ncbi:MAG: hypothetical protein MUQ25_17025 [Candidatus Aminicenantes bacterium]|nr:hypothetical protein [Candidatus Aminicenantes bacterium]
MLVKTRRTRRRRLAAAGWVVFGLLIISSRIGRGVISILSFVTGVHPYPLQVVTDVSLEMSDRDMDVSEFYRGEEKIRLLPEEGGRTANAVAFQDKLLAGCRKKIPLLRPGRFRIGQLPPSVSSEEAKAVERRALDFLNSFSNIDWYYTADASLVFSRDGKSAIYKIALVSYDGPLAASGTGYVVEFVRIDAGWLITKISHSGQWIS